MPTADPPKIGQSPHGVLVTGVHVGYVDTPMASHTNDPKMRPADLVAKVFDAVENDVFEVVADELSAHVKAGLSAPLEALYPELSVNPS